jgi:hypothetical protein
MANVTYLDHHRPATSTAPRTDLLTRLTAFRERALAAWNRHKTERMLEGLPQEIRKDIGWPTTIAK